jgi:thymidylate synthase (FAD)
MTVSYVDHLGSDLSVVNAARASFAQRSESLEAKDIGLIGFLMRERHASPFEHASLTVFVDAPIGVAREWMRHRTQSFNEFSTRYAKVGEPTFYVPPGEALRTQVGKPGAYHFEPMDEAAGPDIQRRFESAYQASLAAYHELLELGVARELARNVLPLGMHTQFYATCNLRNWFNFLSLRTAENALREIREEAAQVETLIEEHFPHSYRFWVEYGRGSI